ncbi:MAG: hypothetical protein JRJ14_03565 [Deltaproteobacteria bacterium]|nr:hypothetical protein [Deltaproteobacteria bacterium]
MFNSGPSFRKQELQLQPELPVCTEFWFLDIVVGGDLTIDRLLAYLE